ncbi:MAG TPA: alpha/beta hydrolase [Burkholderiales bacterium]|nr:alpha/beta hydrolase [Burkholderiales bacterium]
MPGWQPDRLLEGFEALELPFAPDYDGPVVATLVRLPSAEAPRGPVLYVHGFCDYFFQRHMAERFAAEGYAFYALDLRKHGRSLKPHQHPNFCMRIDEYYADLTRALDEIGAPVLLAGHSTGGLVCSLYAHEGERRERIAALWLNSPFFDWRLPDWKRPQLHLAAAIGRFRPFTKSPERLSRAYVKGLLEDWSFDTRLKPVEGFPVFLGWIGAINDAHARVHRGLAIACPVLVMHSDEADIVLDWRHIARYARGLGEKVTVLAFPGGQHDLVLSRPEVREEVFRQLFSWAARAGA